MIPVDHIEVATHIFTCINQMRYASPVVAVRKRGWHRQNDRHPLLRIQNVIHNLGGSKLFKLLDQYKASHQLYVHSDNQKYAWVLVPFGLFHVLACFQYFIKQYLSGYRDKFVILSIKDLLIFSTSSDNYLHQLRLLLQRLINSNKNESM